MTHINKVMKSVNSDCGSTCVDIFLRPDMTFGFEEYRRDVEDARGWFPIGHYSKLIFATFDEAEKAVRQNVTWFCPR